MAEIPLALTDATQPIATFPIHRHIRASVLSLHKNPEHSSTCRNEKIHQISAYSIIVGIFCFLSLVDYSSNSNTTDCLSIGGGAVSR